VSPEKKKKQQTARMKGPSFTACATHQTFHRSVRDLSTGTGREGGCTETEKNKSSYRP